MTMRRAKGGCTHDRCIEIVTGLVAAQLATIAPGLRAEVAVAAMALGAVPELSRPAMQRVARRRLAEMRRPR